MDTPMITDSGRLRISLVQYLARQQVVLHGYAYAICGDHHVADDAVQELSLVVAADPQRVLGGGDDAARWLRAVLRNKTITLARQAGRQRLTRSFSSEVLDALGTCLDDVDNEATERHRRMRSAMADCVAALSGDARRVVEARYCQEHSCEAIAAQVKRSVQAVYAILKRVRQALASCVDERLARTDGHP